MSTASLSRKLKVASSCRKWIDRYLWRIHVSAEARKVWNWIFNELLCCFAYVLWLIPVNAELVCLDSEQMVPIAASIPYFLKWFIFFSCSTPSSAWHLVRIPLNTQYAAVVFRWTLNFSTIRNLNVSSNSEIEWKNGSVISNGYGKFEEITKIKTNVSWLRCIHFSS